jgi:hypothetical protein
VIDLIDLARDRVISDAFILAGDEDLRVGVEVAQRYGVRVHLIGITPCRGNQSQLLRREADTTHEWDDTVVRSFLSLRTMPAMAQAVVSSTVIAAALVVEKTSNPANEPEMASRLTVVAAALAETAEPPPTLEAPEEAAVAAPADKFHAAVSTAVKSLADREIQETLDQWARGAGLPYDVDRQLLRAYGAIVPGDIDMTSKRELRRALISYLKALER